MCKVTIECDGGITTITAQDKSSPFEVSIQVGEADPSGREIACFSMMDTDDEVEMEMCDICGPIGLVFMRLVNAIHQDPAASRILKDLGI
jgi:hypothetical protein